MAELFSLIANISKRDKMLMASPVLFHMPRNITFLETWQVERKIIENIILTETGIAAVLSDILIEFIGSSYWDALAAVSKNPLIEHFTHKIKQQKSPRKAAIQMLDHITRLIKYPKLAARVPKLDNIIELASKISDYDDWTDTSAGTKKADIFYQILMLAWPPIKQN